MKKIIIFIIIKNIKKILHKKIQNIYENYENKKIIHKKINSFKT